jgi:hypothetical protein
LKYKGSPQEAKSRLKVEKYVDPYKRITFVFKKETDLFLAWANSKSKQSEFIPKAKLEVVHSNGEYELSLLEDVINREKDDALLNESHMQQVQGNWNTEKIYWINFHQTKGEVVSMQQIDRLI